MSAGSGSPPTAAQAEQGSQPVPSFDLRSDVRILNYQVGELDKKLDRFFDEVKNSYASKGDLNGLKEDVNKLKDNLSWLIKLVIGAVVIALLGLVISKGYVPHP